jgi:hypothetical protein
MPYSRAQYGGATPGADSATYVLFTTQPTATGIAQNLLAGAGIRKIVLDLKNNQSGTLNTYKSGNGGTTWNQISTEAVGATGSTADVHREYPVEGIQDFKIEWVNGGSAQTAWVVDVALSDKVVNYGAIGVAGAPGAASAAADATANPTLESFLSFLMGFNGTTWDRVRTAVVAKVAASGATGILNTLGLGRYNLSPATLTDGDVQLLQLDSAGNMRTADQFQPVAEDNTVGVIKVEQRFSYTRIATATTTLVKSGAGFLHAIIVNSPVANGVIEFDDALTNTTPIIGKITYPATLVSDGPDSCLYDCSFATGLSITTTGTMDITVVWR